MLLEHPNSEQPRQRLLILLLTLAGFALRLHYLTTSHPFFDEYTTVLAARQILREGWPLLPSGLFYEHGLLATYLIAPFTALFIHTPVAGWEPAHWGLMLARWPSLLISVITIPLLFTLGRRLVGANPALLAAGLLAFSPEGVVWGGRARMYALATLLLWLVVYWAYRAALFPALAKYRWWALGGLLLALLTQFGGMLLVPPLIVGMGVVGWLSHRSANSRSRPWFLGPELLWATLALGLIIGLAVLVKRLGQPLGDVALSSAEADSTLVELLDTVAYQTAFHLTWADTVKFLARQFGVPHHFWLTLTALFALALGLVFPLIPKFLFALPSGAGRNTLTQKPHSPPPSRSTFHVLRTMPHTPFIPPPSPLPLLFLALVFGLIILEMITLLEPFRRNPRYLVMALPLFYLLAAGLIDWGLVQRLGDVGILLGSKIRPFGDLPIPSERILELRRVPFLKLAITLILLACFIGLGYRDLRIALVTPEPAYEEAFAYVYREWKAGDTLFTMNTPAAGLYLDHADGFTVQNEAEQFLLQNGSQPVDRWLGAPWLGTAPDFNTALNEGRRSWFVTDPIRQPVYFNGDWQAVLNSQMEQVWAGDNVLVYRTRPDRVPLATRAKTPVNAVLGDTIQLVGYTLEPASPVTSGRPLDLTLFWQALAPVSADYTIFLHLRDAAGETLAQWDGPPLAGAYPTSRWQPGQLVLDPQTLPLPPNLQPGPYTLLIGLYRLDTLERLPVTHDSSGENAILLAEVEVR